MKGVPRRLTKRIVRGRAVTLEVDAKPVVAYQGETIAAALLASGRRTFRHTIARGEPRGLFCGIGVCFDCLVNVDGANVRACITSVRDGMVISTKGPKKPSSIG